MELVSWPDLAPLSRYDSGISSPFLDPGIEAFPTSSPLKTSYLYYDASSSELKESIVTSIPSYLA